MHTPVNALSALARKHRDINMIDVLPKLTVSREISVKAKPILALKRTGSDGSDSPSPKITLSFIFITLLILKGLPKDDV